jgi:CDGSH-type Zn-finger protein
VDASLSDRDYDSFGLGYRHGHGELRVKIEDSASLTRSGHASASGRCDHSHAVISSRGRQVSTVEIIGIEASVDRARHGAARIQVSVQPSLG